MWILAGSTAGNYTANDLARLKEGGVQKVEGEGLKARAEAEQKLAEAAKAHAEAQAIMLQSRGKYALDVATAYRTLADTIADLRKDGVVIAVDEGDLLRQLLSEGSLTRKL